MTPNTIPPERLERFGVGPAKLLQYAGLKEEYYLADFHPRRDRARAARCRPAARVLVIVRPPPEVTLYHRLLHEVFPRVLERLGPRPAGPMPS